MTKENQLEEEVADDSGVIDIDGGDNSNKITEKEIEKKRKQDEEDERIRKQLRRREISIRNALVKTSRKRRGNLFGKDPKSGVKKGYIGPEVLSRIEQVEVLLLRDPFMTNKEISRILEISVESAKLYRNKAYKGRKDDRIMLLADSDLKIQHLIQERKINKLLSGNSISDNDLNAWDRHAMTRASLFLGDLTDNKGGMISPEALSFYKARMEIGNICEDVHKDYPGLPPGSFDDDDVYFEAEIVKD